VVKKSYTEVYEIGRIAKNVIRWQISESARIDKPDLKKGLEIAIELNGGEKKMYHLVITETYGALTDEAKRFLKEEILDELSFATAVVSTKPVVQNTVTHFEKALEIKSPMRLFTKEAEALKWLLDIKQNNEKKKTVTTKKTKQPATANRFYTRKHEVFIDKYGITHRMVLPDSHIDAAELQKLDTFSRKLNNGDKILLLVNAQPVYTITSDATRYLAKISSKHRIATAVVSANMNEKILINFIVKEGAPPMKVFSTKADAVKWLLSFKSAKKKTSPSPPAKRKKST